VPEQAGADVIGLKAETQTRHPAVIGAATELRGESVPANSRKLRLLVDSANQAVQPGLPTALPPSDLRPNGVDKELRVFAGYHVGSERGGDIAFHSEPIVGEVAERGVQTDSAGVKDRGTEAVPGNAEAELPAEIITAAENKLRFGCGWISGGTSGVDGDQ